MDHNLCLNLQNNNNNNNNINLNNKQQHQQNLLINDFNKNLIINNNYDYDKYNYNYQQYEFNCNSIENTKTKKSLTKNLYLILNNQQQQPKQEHNLQQQQESNHQYSQQQLLEQKKLHLNKLLKENHQNLLSTTTSSSFLSLSSILTCSFVKKRSTIILENNNKNNNNIPMSSSLLLSSSSSLLSPLTKKSSITSSKLSSTFLTSTLLNNDDININLAVADNKIYSNSGDDDDDDGSRNNKNYITTITTTTTTTTTPPQITRNIKSLKNTSISNNNNNNNNNSIKLLISEYFRLISCSWADNIKNYRQKHRRRGRLRKYYIIELNLLIISLILSYIINIMKNLYRFMKKLIISKIFTTKLIWIFGIYVAIQILPINIVNAYNSNELNFDEDDNENDSLLYSTENSNIGSTETYDSDNKTLPIKTPLFPKDLFSKTQLENGAVAFHIIGVIYMFVALAIVCDEFFVPALDVIIEKLGITDDVAGATFMAAGGSAPELFTSVIGVFVSFDDVGIGTIVGSAVFNILFVIGMCALFSKTILSLTWWPLFRDCTFYSISLLTLIYFFRDNLIYWWEALVLFFIYIGYVGFMKWNQQVERCVKKIIYKNKVTRVRSTDQLMPAGNAANSSETSMATQPGGSVTSRAASETRSGPPGSSSGATGNSSGGSTHTGAKFRHGLLQLMIHTIDPLHDDDVPGKVDEKATQLHAIASLKVLLDATKPQRGAATTSAANHVKINLKETTLANDRPNGNIDTTIDSPSNLSGRRHSWIEQRVAHQQRRFSIKGNDPDEMPEALDMAWPQEGRKRITYVLVAPLLFPLWLTLPDTKTPKGKKYYPVTFIGSIVWIAAYSYLMVWWANVAGDTARIPPEVMGLTFLAAGTSIPDLITSVIVARKGFGDMAVSSSVGSNIFDVTVGLPIPWLLYGIIYQQPVEVNSHGMVCSITILFMMLLFVVMSIACFHWKMNKGLGLTMFLLYFVFVAVSLMFEYKKLTCPV